MKLSRRFVIQQIGVTLAALGVSQSDWFRWGDRYRQAIAQPTSRKLALLIGINQYPDAAFQSDQGGIPLSGCVTDVQLQRELLIYRFGFNPRDIVTLTNEQATRQVIQTTFLEHLTRQAQAGDVVLVHFSGFGSQIQVQSGQETTRESALVPVDGVIPADPADRLQDLPLTSLWLLLQSLATDQVTTVLDTSYQVPNRLVRSSIHGRSRPIIPQGKLSLAELSFQEERFAEIKLPREKWLAQQRAGQGSGIILSAAQMGGLAVETQWNGFSAGLFTYALTQHLWNTTPATTLRIVLSRTATDVEQRIGLGQNPDLSGQSAADPRLVPYYLPVTADTTAEGTVTSVETNGETLSAWLGGVPALVLAQYGNGAILEIVPRRSPPADPTSDPVGPLYQVRSRSGITVKAKRLAKHRPAAVAPVQVGDRVLDVVRLFPESLGLTVALDNQLERIERVDATSAFAGVSSVSSVVSAEQPADCFFGKAQDVIKKLPSDPLLQQITDAAKENPDVAVGSTVPKTGYGLFSIGRAAIPQTLNDEEEAVKNAITRLTPSLQTLLAIKLLRLTLNAASSRLAVRATLELIQPEMRLVMQQQTVRSDPMPAESQIVPLMVANGNVPSLAIDSHIHYRLENVGDRPLYFVLISWESSGGVIFYPVPPTPLDPGSGQSSTVVESVLSPGQTIAVPAAAIATEWMVRGPRGFTETHLVVSEQPFKQTFATLPSAMQSMNNGQYLGGVAKPLPLIQALLADLTQASRAHTDGLDLPADHYLLHREAWATLRFVYQIV